MSKVESIYRYFFIIQRVRKGGANSQEIIDYLDRQGEHLDYNFKITERTLQRDINDIRNIFSIFIVYDRKEQKYKIEYDDANNSNFKIMETLEWLSLMKMHKNIHSYISFERKDKNGLEQLATLLDAIRKHKVTNFWYVKSFDVIHTGLRTTHPLGLKEFKSHWYLIAKDTKDGYIKTFGLDRIHKIEPTSATFTPPQDFNLSTFFKHCFGIIRPHTGHPQEVVLTFFRQQSKYIKYHRLHHSQEIIEDSDTHTTVKLYLYITYDFVMELLSFGNNVKVIASQSLADEMRETHLQALEQYSKNN